MLCLGVWNNCHLYWCGKEFNCRCRNDLNFYYGIGTTESECIDQSWLCDGIRDCSGGEDERDCVCSDDKFQCNICGRDDECSDGIPYHQCISTTLVGDGKLWHPRSSHGCVNHKDESEAIR